MKPHVMYALSRELQTYIKSLKTVDLASLVEINPLVVTEDDQLVDVEQYRQKGELRVTAEAFSARGDEDRDDKAERAAASAHQHERVEEGFREDDRVSRSARNRSCVRGKRRNEDCQRDRFHYVVSVYADRPEKMDEQDEQYRARQCRAHRQKQVREMSRHEMLQARRAEGPLEDFMRGEEHGYRDRSGNHRPDRVVEGGMRTVGICPDCERVYRAQRCE